MIYVTLCYRKSITGGLLAPPYLHKLCCSTTQVQRCCCLRSATEAELIVSACRQPLGSALPVCFLCCWPCDMEWASYRSGPATWNGLPTTLALGHGMGFLPLWPCNMEWASYHSGPGTWNGLPTTMTLQHGMGF